MFNAVLRRIRALVAAGQYVMTLHAEEEMEDDDLTILGVEQAVLSGTIVERQRDRRTAEYKYLIHGDAMDGRGIGVVAKVTLSNRVAVLTVFALREDFQP